jgi:hypothetical protein
MSGTIISDVCPELVKDGKPCAKSMAAMEHAAESSRKQFLATLAADPEIKSFGFSIGNEPEKIVYRRQK